MNHALIPATIVTTMCAHRNDVLARMEAALRMMREAHEIAKQADQDANAVHGGTVFFHRDRSRQDGYRRIFDEIDVDASLALYRQQLDARAWKHLLAVSGLDKAMDLTAKEQFDATLCGEVPELTEDNILATFASLGEDARLIFARGVARAFSQLDPRFRSHDAFRFEDRVVLTHVFDAFGFMSERMRDMFLDIERVFAVLDGREPEGWVLVEAIREARGRSLSPRQGSVDSRYFKIRTFKNGNMHLWMQRSDLVERVNRVLADYYGDVLPDAMPADYGVHEPRTTALSKDLAFYPTPDKVIDVMLRDLRFDHDSVVLEPSAGTGNIVNRVLALGARVTAVEVDAGRVATLRASRPISNPARFCVVHANFLTMGPTPTYTHVAMNPPFAGTHWMDHVRHAFDFLAPGGILVAVVPVTVETGTTAKHEAFRAWVDVNRPHHWRRAYTDLPAEAFASSGTRVNTVLLTIGKKA